MSTSPGTPQTRWIKIGSDQSEAEPAQVWFDYTDAVIEVWTFAGKLKDLSARHFFIGDLVGPAAQGPYLTHRMAKPILPQEPGVRESDEA